MDKISIIIPVYNREKYIRECIESILSQTYPISNIEIIIVDDCSTDSSVDIIKEYESQYPDNILLIQCDKNSSGYIGLVRNIGLSYSSGEWIMFLDSDDKLLPNCLSKLHSKALAYDVDAIGAGFTVFSDHDVIGHTNKIDYFYDMNNPINRKAIIMQLGLDGNVWGKLYRKKFLIDKNITFPEDQHVAEDTLFLGQILLTAKRYYNMAECLYMYRFHNNSTWNNKKSLSYVTDCIKADQILYRIYLSQHLDCDDEFAWKCYGGIYLLKQKMSELGALEEFSKLIPYFKEHLNNISNIKNNKYILQDTSEYNTKLMQDLEIY